MKKILPGISILLFAICGCKKDNNTNVNSTTNLDVTVTCQCTFDVHVTQRVNTTLQYYNVDTKTSVSNKYEIKLNGQTKDLISIAVTNASVPPFIVNVDYNGASIDNENSLLDANGTINVYVP